MKNKNPITVRIGSSGHPINEYRSGVLFEHPEITDSWRILESTGYYILCNDRSRHLTFLEFYPDKNDRAVLYKGREWERRPRDDNFYILAKPKKFHGKRMPVQFGQALKRALLEPQDTEATV